MHQDIQTNIPQLISVSFQDDVCSSLKTLLAAEIIPHVQAVEGAKPWDLGIELDWLSHLRDKMLSDAWKVDDLVERINRWPNYLVSMKAKTDTESEMVDIHFLHVKSTRKDAIPLMMLHGWPGLFWDFRKVIEPLTNPPADKPAFHLVIPSLPGFFLSSHPRRHDWTIVDTARLLHRLMTEVIGYRHYCGQGGDWGSLIFRLIGNLYPSEVTAIHFNMLFLVPRPINMDTTTFTLAEKRTVERAHEFARSGRGYVELQSTKPFTIGIAIGSSPLGLLTYIGEKMYSWSDPAKIDAKDVLDNVGLYYLSKCFPTSVMIYNLFPPLQNEMSKRTKDGELSWKIKTKVGFSLFPYEIGGLPRAYLQQVADLRFYKEHETGGHFPALDNPLALIGDLREFLGDSWGKRLVSAL